MEIVTSLETMLLTELKGVGEKTSQAFQQIGIRTVAQLLFYLPIRYEDRTTIITVANCQLGAYAQVEGEVLSARVQFGKRRSLVVQLYDGTGQLEIRLFHFYQNQITALQQDGVRLRVYGQVRMGPKGLGMIHPQYQIIQEVVPLADRLTPVYRIAQGLQQAGIRKLMQQALTLLQQGFVIEDLLPAAIKQQYALPDLQQALMFLHAPSPGTDAVALANPLHPLRQRLVIEELLAHQVCLVTVKAKQQTHYAPPLSVDELLKQRFLKALPFACTKAQQKVIADIEHDLAQARPMMRLVQGDVGSGKTVVAAIAMLAALAQKKQVALMAPTELLAQQHFISFQQWLTPLGFTVDVLLGSQTAATQRNKKAALAAGDINCMIGTHALFQDDVMFHDCALVIIDEQHRFGVRQRLRLSMKGRDGEQWPHQLIMSATPIPRTLAMVAYADLDVSVIDELPPGRTPIKTVMLPHEKRAALLQRLHKVCVEDQRQVYWVCPLIDESDMLDAQAAETVFKELQQQLADVRVALVHGRMKAKEKDEIIQQFLNQSIQILVATTVIEVGINVPNASVMVIDNPERLGLAQLHQLRGRVGRGEINSFCVLHHGNRLSQLAQQRLQLLCQHHDGFALAEADLKLRGPGVILGEQQSGEMTYQFADLTRDLLLMPIIAEIGQKMIKNKPFVSALIQRWVRNAQELIKS